MWDYIRWLCKIDERMGSSSDKVSYACRRAIIRNESTHGVDLPTWHTPTEIEEMRKSVRCSALRLVEPRTGTRD